MPDSPRSKPVGGSTLTTIARQWPLAGTRRMTLRERAGRPEREARSGLRFGVVTITRPRDAGAPAMPAQVTLNLIELTELQCRCRLTDCRLVPGPMDHRTAVSAAQETRIVRRR